MIKRTYFYNGFIHNGDKSEFRFGTAHYKSFLPNPDHVIKGIINNIKCESKFSEKKIEIKSFYQI